MEYNGFSDKILNKGIITIYHGNRDSSMVPEFKTGTYDKDFGIGFYATLDPEMAKSWAYTVKSPARLGYMHIHNLHTLGLHILDFNRVDSLYWLAEVVRNRYYIFKSKLSSKDLRTVSGLLEQYRIANIEGYDIIIGCSFDTSIVDYAHMLIQGYISKEMFDNILRQYSYCAQICLKSKFAFQALSNHDVKRVPVVYRGDFQQRDAKTRELVANIHSSSKNTTVGDYLVPLKGIASCRVDTKNLVQVT